MLGLGIGASTAIFSALQALVFRPLPIASEQRVVAGIALREGFDPFGTSLLEYQALLETAKSIDVAGVGRQRSFEVAGGGDPERIAGASVSATYFSATGIEPVLGRRFSVADDAVGGPAVAMIGYGLWHRRYGGSPSVIGRLLDLDGRRHEIVGVMPQGVDMPYGAELWTPLQADIQAMPLRERGAHVHELMARLRPGVTVVQADDEVKAIARQLEAREPQAQRGWSYRVVPVRRFLTGDLDGRVQRAVSILVAAVALLLVICCANLATLMLALGVTRQREMGLRLALGASRGRLVRQLMTESLALGLAGGAAGMLLAAWIIPGLAALSPLEVVSLRESFRDFRVDWRVMTSRRCCRSRRRWHRDRSRRFARRGRRTCGRHGRPLIGLPAAIAHGAAGSACSSRANWRWPRRCWSVADFSCEVSSASATLISAFGPIPRWPRGHALAGELTRTVKPKSCSWMRCSRACE